MSLPVQYRFAIGLPWAGVHHNTHLNLLKMDIYILQSYFILLSLFSLLIFPLLFSATVSMVLADKDMKLLIYQQGKGSSISDLWLLQAVFSPFYCIQIYRYAFFYFTVMFTILHHVTVFSI